MRLRRLATSFQLGKTNRFWAIWRGLTYGKAVIYCAFLALVDIKVSCMATATATWHDRPCGHAAHATHATDRPCRPTAMPPMRRPTPPMRPMRPYASAYTLYKQSVYPRPITFSATQVVECKQLTRVEEKIKKNYQSDLQKRGTVIKYKC